MNKPLSKEIMAKPKMKVREAKKDMTATVQKQESDFEAGISMSRPKRVVREVVEINGKKYFVV